MARREITVTLHDRDKDLVFTIKEMPATKLEDWLNRAATILISSGINVPAGANIEAAGAYLASQGPALFAGLEYEKVRPLIDELLGCCWRIVDKLPIQCTPENVDSYIEDVQTLYKLKWEAAKLNLGFLKAGLEKLSLFHASQLGASQ